MLKIWKTPVLRERLLATKLKNSRNLLKNCMYNFSAGSHGHGHSGSGSEHEHEHEHDHHEEHKKGAHSHYIIENYDQEVRSRIFRKSEVFSVEKLLNQMSEPLNQTTIIPNLSEISVYNSQEEYINFLAQNFERKALENYPEYKIHLDKFKHLIPQYETLNAYAREVYTLDTYLHWKLELDEHQIREAYNFSGSASQRAAQRENFFKNLTSEDHHADTTIMHHLKEQLRELISKEKEFEDFKHRYDEETEKQLVQEIVEKRKQTFYFDYAENKTEINQQLFDLNSEGNKHKFVSHATPHDHIHPQHFNHDPEKLNEEKWKYLAYFDIILDQHLRKIRPSSISESDETFKYVKDEYKPLKSFTDHLRNNMYYDYLFTLDNEFHVKFKAEVERVFNGMNLMPEVDDPVNFF